jgi:hypothetical protein
MIIVPTEIDVPPPPPVYVKSAKFFVIKSVPVNVDAVVYILFAPIFSEEGFDVYIVYNVLVNGILVDIYVSNYPLFIASLDNEPSAIFVIYLLFIFNPYGTVSL